jgi:hypothetical protein
MRAEKILEKVQTEKGQFYLGLMMMSSILGFGVLIGLSICKIF